MATQELLSGKLLREFQTIKAMVEIYCRAHQHGPFSECKECQEFLEYAYTRLDRCPYGQNKPTCNKCPVHCYKPHLKAKAKEIMVFSGPKMLLPHPIMAIRHLLSGREPVPAKVPLHQSNRHIRKQQKQH